MPRGRFRLLEGDGQGQVVRVLRNVDGYAGCCQTRVVEVGKDEGGFGKEGGRKKCPEWMGEEIRALRGTRRRG